MYLARVLRALAQGLGVAAPGPTGADIDRAVALLGADRAVSIAGGTLPAAEAASIVLGVALTAGCDVGAAAAHLRLSLPTAAALPDPERGGSRWAAAAAALGERMIARAGSRSYRDLALHAVDAAVVRLHGEVGTPELGVLGEPGRRGGRPPRPVCDVGVRVALGAAVIVDVVIVAREDAGDSVANVDALAARLYRSVAGDALVFVGDELARVDALAALASGDPSRHWLCRASTSLPYRRIKSLERDDDLIELRVSTPARLRDAALPPYLVGRGVGYRRVGVAEETLFTSLADPRRYPRHELVTVWHELWHERWLALREPEKEAPRLTSDEAEAAALSGWERLGDAAANTPVWPVLPGDTPEQVSASVGALLLAHNLVIGEVARARASSADGAGAVDMGRAAAALSAYWRRVMDEPSVAVSERAALVDVLAGCGPAPQAGLSVTVVPR